MLFTKNTLADRMIYQFQFSICDNRMVMAVYSFDLAEIVLFLNQHGFKYDECKDYIKEVPYTIDIEEKAKDKMLKLVIFKSNSMKEKFSVMTTDLLLEKCVINTGEILTSASWFGTIITENDKFPIIDIINNFIESLTYGTIMDYQLLTENNYGDETVEPDRDLNIIKERLCSSLLNTYGNESETIQDFTIESYIQGFTSLL